MKFVTTNLLAKMSVFALVTVGASSLVARADNEMLERAADRIERAFERDSILSRFDLDADEENNRIEIEGTVRTAAERARAQSIARAYVPRKYALVNKIKIRARR